MVSSLQRGQVKKHASFVRWVKLGILSIVVILIFDYFAIPAVLMLGSMVAAILFAISGNHLHIPKRYFYCSQVVIGTVTASRIDSTIITSFVSHYALYLGIVLITLFVTSAMGFWVARAKWFPGTTAVWGISPGASAAMVIMSASYGGDSRLVAFMQYARVLFVALVATFTTKLFISSPGGSDTSALFPLLALDWFPSLPFNAFSATALLMIVAGVLGKISKIPAGCMLVPMVVCSFAHGSGFVKELILPEWLLALSYVSLGWNIGLGFTREVLQYAIKLLPKIIGIIAILIGFCIFLAWLLVYFMHVDPLTAYLATSPGGMDTIAIIATTSRDVNLPLVMTLQPLRLLLVVLFGPHLSHYIASRIEEKQ